MPTTMPANISKPDANDLWRPNYVRFVLIAIKHKCTNGTTRSIIDKYYVYECDRRNIDLPSSHIRDAWLSFHDSLNCAVGFFVFLCFLLVPPNKQHAKLHNCRTILLTLRHQIRPLLFSSLHYHLPGKSLRSVAPPFLKCEYTTSLIKHPCNV